MGIVVGVGVGVSAGLGVGVGVEVSMSPLKTTLGGLLLVSVIAKLLVVSCMVKVSFPAFCEVTVKVACPFCA